MFETSDEYDFTPSTSSNLASLFGTSMAIPDGSNPTLVYTAPKQPKPAKEIAKETPIKAKQQSAVICAKVVTLYKLQNNKYDALGKHGLALIKAEAQNNQELIIYKEKTNIITRSKITDEFQFVIQNDSFSSFIDDSKQTWVLKFESLEDRDFISSELKKLGGNILDNTHTVTKDNSSTASLRQTGLPETKNEPADTKSREVSKSSNEEKLSEDEVNSDSPQSQVKADILSRMAKMGQLVMSNNNSNQTVDMSDSDTTDGKQVVKPQRKPRKLLPHRDKEIVTKSDPQPAERYSNTVSNMALTPHQFQTDFQAVHTNSVAMLQPNAVEKYLIDDKARDTELKLNLCEISTKLDYLIKSSHYPNQSFNSPNTHGDTTLRSKVKALQLRAENLTSELHTWQIKYSQLQDINKTFEEKLKTVDRSEVTSRAQELRISELERQLEKLETELESAKVYETENEKYKTNIVELTKELEEARKDATKNVELNVKNVNCEEVGNDKNEEKEKLSETIKQSMNSMYEEIMRSLGDRSDEVRPVISRVIRRTTFKILKDFNEI